MNDKLMGYLNPIECYLQKPAKDFTKADMIKYITENNIQMLNFRYVAGDGRLKALNFVIHSVAYLEEILTSGERVDGSSLFPFIEVGSSDLYVIPRFNSAFMDPFSALPTISFLCNYFDKDGNPLASSPAYILHKAHEAFKKTTGGMEFHAMGELEFYVIGDKPELFPAVDQKGYHESGPFNKFEQFRCEAMNLMAQVGCKIKYGHSEVGNFTLGDKIYEQNEIEFLPVMVEEAAEQLIMGKWILNNLACKHNLNLTFSPKISVGKAGSGMHIHTKIVKYGVNQYVQNGALSDTAHKAIAGMLTMASSLTAFGNTNPTSYFRLVPHQEAPTTICWGDRNRSVLVRVPLGWKDGKNMCRVVNPNEPDVQVDFSSKQTIEFRCPDGSANIYLLLAGMTVAVRHGFEMENALDFAKKTYVSVNIHKSEFKDKLQDLACLPTCCEESATALKAQREVYECCDIFSPALIDNLVAKLNDFADKDIRQRIFKDPALLQKIVDTYFYC